MGNHSGAQPNIQNLILVPAVITLAVTVLRLAGELEHWSKTFFNSDIGGPGSIIGITWLAPVFGIYFAIKLANSNEWPPSVLRAVGFAVLGIGSGIGLGYVGGPLHVDRNFYVRLVYGWLFFALAGVIAWPGWPSLFKTLLAYALAARIPVAIVMLIAIYGNWGTHYDVAPSDMPPMGSLAKWLWIGFFPQMLLWVGFTLATGMLFGAITAGVLRMVRRTNEVGQ